MEKAIKELNLCNLKSKPIRVMQYKHDMKSTESNVFIKNIDKSINK